MFNSRKEESSKDSADSEDSDELIRRLQSSIKMKARNGKSRSAGCQKVATPTPFASPSRRKAVGRALDRSYASYVETYSRNTSATSNTSTSTGSVLISPEKRLFAGSFSSGTSAGKPSSKTLLPPLQILSLEDSEQDHDPLPGSVESEWRPRVASPSIPVPVTRSSVERQHNDIITECEVEVQRIKCQCFRSRLQSRSCGTQTDPRPPTTLRNPWFGKDGENKDDDVTGDSAEFLQLKATDSESSVQNREDGLASVADKSEITQIRRLVPKRRNGCLAMFRKCCSLNRKR